MSDELQPLLTRFEPQELAVVTADPQVLAARFHPAGKLLVAGGFDGRVRWWDLSADMPQELPASTGHNGWVQAITFSRDGRRLYTADSWGKLCAWDISDGGPQLAWSLDEAHAGWLRDVDGNVDGSGLVTCGRDRVVRIWAAGDGAPRRSHRGARAGQGGGGWHP